MNPNRERGIRAEREACTLLDQLLFPNEPAGRVRRRANEGIRDDIGDLYGVPDVCFQVTAIGYQSPAKIGERARRKVADCELQAARRNIAHAVVLMRIDGQSNRPAIWRAIIGDLELARLYARDNWYFTHQARSQGALIRDLAPGAHTYRTWLQAPGLRSDLFTTTLQGWATSYQQAKERAA